MLRLIAIDRAFHFVVLGGLAVLVLLFSADRRTLHDTFYKVVADLQGGVVSGQTHATPRPAARAGHPVHDLLCAPAPARRRSCSATALLEGIEAVGLWYQRRWAEYLTFLVTASLLPFEIYEIAHPQRPRSS